MIRTYADIHVTHPDARYYLWIREWGGEWFVYLAADTREEIDAAIREIEDR